MRTLVDFMIREMCAGDVTKELGAIEDRMKYNFSFKSQFRCDHVRPGATRYDRV